MKKPPIPTFVAAYPAPGQTTKNNPIVIMAVVLIIVISIALIYYKLNKNTTDESN